MIYKTFFTLIYMYFLTFIFILQVILDFQINIDISSNVMYIFGSTCFIVLFILEILDENNIL